MSGVSSSNTAIGRLVRTGLLGGALICAALSGAGASPSPDTAPAEDKEPPALVLPGQEGFTFGLLGSLEIRTPTHRFQAQWQDILKRVDAERDRYTACQADADCTRKLKAWRALVAELQGLPQREQMERVNIAVNRLVKYTDDAKAFRARDHWATPLETLSRGGDCEDYAILKFVTLLDLGFDADQLRVTIVRNRARNIMHAVLAVKLDGKTFILDNLNNHAVEHHYVLKYVPLYSASLDGQWVHIVTSQIRACFVTHVMRKQEQVEKAPAERVTKADDAPAPRRAGENRVILVGSYSEGWT